jgi:hypothetical protein
MPFDHCSARGPPLNASVRRLYKTTAVWITSRSDLMWTDNSRVGRPLVKQTTLFARASACLLLPLLVSCNPPVVLQPETIFRATFSSDAVNSPPGNPEVGTWNFLHPDDGTILVRSAVGALANKPLEVTHFGTAAGSPKLSGDFAGNPVSSGQVVARWSSLVHSSNAEFASVGFSGAGGVVATVDYRRLGEITLNSQTNVVGSWTRDVAQTFEMTIDMDKRTISLKINQIAVPGAQAVPFSSASGPAVFNRIFLGVGGSSAEVHAWDDIEVMIWR